MNANCKNCKEVLNGKFCQNCGQKASINRITFKETFQDFMDMVFSVNAPLMLTLKMLVVNPGKLFREYLSGKRKKYYKPVSFLILTTIVYVLVMSLLGYNPMDGFVIVDAIDERTKNLLVEAGEYFSKNGNNIVFIFVFTLALSLKLFFSKRYLLSEYVAISFYIIGFYILITSVFVFYLKFVNPELKMLPLLALMLYVIYALTSFFKRKNFGMIIRVFLTYLVSLLFYMLLAFSLSFLIVWIKSL